MVDRSIRVAAPDFSRVAPEHDAIDARLVNWARYVKDHGAAWMSPIWRLGKPMGRYATMEPRCAVDEEDALRIERAVSELPEMQRGAIRWCYVYRFSPARMARILAVRYDTLAWLVNDARQRLNN